MLAWTIGYIASLLTFVLADMVWLGLMAARFYRPILGDIALPGVALPPAILFYLIYPVGILVLAVHPALRAGSPALALLYGALFGFFTYATYDLTNHATLRNWTAGLTAVDVGWGTLLGMLTSLAGYVAITRFSDGG